MRDSFIGEERADRGKLAGLFLFFRARSLSKSIAAKTRAQGGVLESMPHGWERGGIRGGKAQSFKVRMRLTVPVS
jgi:hypothetical protein